MASQEPGVAVQRTQAGLKHVTLLTEQLRELEQAQLVTRTVHPVVPSRVDYEIPSSAARPFPLSKP